MTSPILGLTLVVSAILSLALAVPAMAQSNGAPASTLMHSAGESMKAAGSDTWAATKDTYHAAKTALHDTTITTKVKLALDRNSTTHPYHIHVATTAGVVTLNGKIPSPEVATRALQLAMATRGVRRVRDRMVVISGATSPSYTARDNSGGSGPAHE
jgi:hyperosmotically inducible periplasmic protein